MTASALRFAPRPVRVVIWGEEGASEVEFDAVAGATIGRDERCTVSLESSLVSRRHASVSVQGEHIFLTDSSANGTFVGDELVHQATLEVAPGTPVRIGPFQLRFDPIGLAVEDGPDGEPRRVASTRDVSSAVRREIHRRLLEHLDLAKLERSRMNPHMMRAKVRLALQAITPEVSHLLPASVDVDALIEELTHEAVGLGPLEALLADDRITEIMVVDPQTVYVERGGRLELTQCRFTDEESARAILERIVTPLGRRIDESAPMLDARLADGSRVNAVISPIALRGACITIRKFSRKPYTADDLIRFGSVTDRMVRFLHRCVMARKNMLVAGGTGSGKTTLLNVLSSSIPEEERIVTIEDSAELQLNQSHVVSLEARPPNMEGRGAIAIRDLVKNAMRMRPDRVIVGECRGGEALDMLQAMSTGHDGSMTTTHANSPREALKRIETLSLMSGIDLPSSAIRQQIALALNVLVQQTRFADGTRRVTSIAEVVGMEDHGDIEVREIFGFRRTGTGDGGKVSGEFYATGYLPSFLDEFIAKGLIDEGEGFL
ncbi:MAG TPA: ATPase, T2SS/T4P/T4SS family [Kofleriaceae bacterium]|nr:ATPase, T2SS/T4P/T4SS family [Kofleriaceae bacterium]